MCIERNACGALSVASVTVMELCIAARRYLDIEASIAGLLAVEHCQWLNVSHFDHVVL